MRIESIGSVSRIILVAGYAASGKTHVARALARSLVGGCYLDKDTITTPFVERLLLALGQQPGDRDSEVYRREIRPLEYESLLAAGLQTAETCPNVILSAPFLCQITDLHWMAHLQREISSRDVKLRTVWVHCDRTTLRSRMLNRGSPRDKAKLEDWPTYSAAVDEHFHRKIRGECFVFDNSDVTRFKAELGRLVAYLSADNSAPA